MYTIWWAWTYENTDETIALIKVRDASQNVSCVCVCVCVCVWRTPNVRFTLLTNSKMDNPVLLIQALHCAADPQKVAVSHN